MAAASDGGGITAVTEFRGEKHRAPDATDERGDGKERRRVEQSKRFHAGCRYY